MQTHKVIAYVEPALMSNGQMIGLVNVATSDGRRFFDLTMGQLRSMASMHGWDIRTQNCEAEGELPPMQFVGPDGEELKVLNVRAESRELVVQLAARPVAWTPARSATGEPSDD